MKKIVVILLLLCSAGLVKASAQSYEVEQLLLDVQKLSQLKQILSGLKTGYDILSKGYTTIRDISEGNFNLHEAFLDGLWLVSPTVRQYWKIPQIINDQVEIVKEYQTAFAGFKKEGRFTPDEITYIGDVYGNLLSQSLQNLTDLTHIVTADKLRMSDQERLSAIDRLYADMQDKLLFLRDFDNNTAILALQRAKEQNDARTMQQVYGITP